jgi:hypothetical protein
MCEYCDKSEVAIDPLDADQQEQCEWFDENAGPGVCPAAAVFSVSSWYVEDHLCEEHKLATEKEMDEGLGDFMERVGFRSQFDIRPIEQEETCDYFAPDSADWKPCGGKASFAKYILDTSLMCAEHTAEMTQNSDET